MGFGSAGMDAQANDRVALVMAGTILSQASLPPNKFRATGPTCNAAQGPIKNSSHPGQRRCLSSTGKPLTVSMG